MLVIILLFPSLLLTGILFVVTLTKHVAMYLPQSYPWKIASRSRGRLAQFHKILIGTGQRDLLSDSVQLKLNLSIDQNDFRLWALPSKIK